MSKKIEFFYDYVSVYSYLANSQLHRLAGNEVVCRPMFLGGVMQETGNRPPGTVKAKGRYLKQDVARWLQRYSMTLNWNPIFPQNTIKALRLALVAGHEGSFDILHPALFEAMWVAQADLSDEPTLAAIVEQTGLPADRYMTAITEPEIKEELKRNTAEAIERGAFGAPAFFVGDEMFFGNDRFEFILEAAAG